MSLTKKDPSLRVAANDPHLVSLGGGRLSTGVTIHYIPIGDTTIGSSTACNISLNGSGVRSTHCTIYRSEENEVTIVPEKDARILIDNTKITHEANLTQGAMITIGNSNYLRFNNPAEAQMMRSAMGSNERISMPQIDFTQVPQRNSAKSIGSNGVPNEHRQSMHIESFYETNINPTNYAQMSMSISKEATKTSSKAYNNMGPIDINGLHCPKVFTADLVTVNMPAKDVLGQKYASFAKNLAENHRNDKNINNNLKNQANNIKINASNQNGSGNYVNIPSTSNYIQNTNLNIQNNRGSSEYLTKINNATPPRNNSYVSNHHNVTAYDRYPKPGTYGGLQIYPMTGVNTEINNGSTNSSPMHKISSESASAYTSNLSQSIEQKRNFSKSDSECLEDMLKICTEYTDRQNQSCNSITSSPIVQNRIKTNGSLPREKKSPFHNEQTLTTNNTNLNTKTYNGTISASSGYENVRLVGQNRVEISGQLVGSHSPKTGYENVVIGKYVPQSPRTKIRTTCMSPKKEVSFGNLFSQPIAQPTQAKLSNQNEYEQLIKTFEEKLKLEMQAIAESSRYQPGSNSKAYSSADQTPAKRINKNINNLTLNIQQSHSLQNSPKLSRKPAPAPRTLSRGNSDSVKSLQNIEATKTTTINSTQVKDCIKILENADLDQLKEARKDILMRIQDMKNKVSDLQKQEDEVLRELDMEKALVSAELSAVGVSVSELENQLKLLQNKIYRLEAQRNATRVMEENQQAKLKQSIEMKQDQVKKLKAMLKQKPNNECLKEEIHNVCESLENDRKTFEDLEFQYLEEESEWHAYREELNAEEKGLSTKIEEKCIELKQLEKQNLTTQNYASTDAKALNSKLITILNELKLYQEQLKSIDNSICDITGQIQPNSSDDDENIDDKLSSSTISPPLQSNLVTGVMSQSLFGSAELLCPKRTTEDIMSKSVNENMFYNNRIELPCANATSTPKRTQLKIIDITENELKNTSDKPPKSPRLPNDPLLRIKQNMSENEDVAQNERVKFNLSLGSDDFEVNPLEKRVPSQDDIDRICKVTLDAPISTKGASTKIFDSIKEIERNRQLLLAQQGPHVIEHERQKMNDLKKKSHDEARAQYLSMLNNSVDGSNNCTTTNSQAQIPQEQELQKLKTDKENSTQMNKINQKNNYENKKQQNADIKNLENNDENSSQVLDGMCCLCNHSKKFSGLNPRYIKKLSTSVYSLEKKKLIPLKFVVQLVYPENLDSAIIL
ncbi:pleckstrin homology-like domain family B member 1 [Teleopsis dalmanni]|uniref:pleckstrin homology-like domain family B member 1 n=1 Tax=Teleopsis dalmanni TaxID=139649 RepID=UPI0018CD97B2|nr:pleckstrin homology-like domain family B member 1 [Teleopsis dalmanni]